ncbi:MAG: hypothetical protein K8U03_09005 [Planctomycetia bacterium]|nr:hypothetical protein [Planctomycetia bacterium]
MKNLTGICLLLGFVFVSLGAATPAREANIAGLRKLGFVPQSSTIPGDPVKLKITAATLKQLESLMKKDKTIYVEESGEIQVR